MAGDAGLNVLKEQTKGFADFRTLLYFHSSLNGEK
jgi:hypothetical protein